MALLRVAWAAISLALLAVPLLAHQLVPAQSGHGTHIQLGLGPCAFLMTTGLPCPGCGLTTSFAHLVRFELGAALRAHALGPLLFAINLTGVPLSVFGCVRAWRFERTCAQLRILPATFVLAVLWLGAWIARIAPALFA